MNKQKVTSPIQYCYNNVQMRAIQQHEIMLVSIYNHYREEIGKELISIKSSENKNMGLNIIEIHVSSKMNINTVKQTLEAMNTTAFYALLPKERGEFFDMMSKENKS